MAESIPNRILHTDSPVARDDIFEMTSKSVHGFRGDEGWKSGHDLNIGF